MNNNVAQADVEISTIITIHHDHDHDRSSIMYTMCVHTMAELSQQRDNLSGRATEAAAIDRSFKH